MPDERPPLDTRRLHDLVGRWQDGSRGGADELLRTAGARLEHLARAMLGRFPAVRDAADTGDVLQGASLRLLAALGELRPASTRDFYNLAAALVRRELLDLARWTRRRPAGHLDGGPGPPADPPDPAAASAGDPDWWCRFHEAVGRLPTEEREVVGLVFYHGWTQARVAELFGVADRTVRRWWASACTRLAGELGAPPPG